jgi:lipoprotein-anchoring transpeptidase ErfK/SrfK
VEEEEVPGHTMKPGSLLIAASMLFAMAAFPSSAHAARHLRHHHARVKKTEAALATGASLLDDRADTAQEISISEIPAADLIVGPAVTLAMPRGGAVANAPATFPVPEAVAALQIPAPPAPSSVSYKSLANNETAAKSSVAAKPVSASTPAAVASPAAVAAIAPATTAVAVTAAASQINQRPADIPGIDGISMKKANALTPQQTAMTPGEILYNNTHDASIMDPTNWNVTIYKHQHALTLYYKGNMYRKYDAVFGRNLDHAAKAYAQDRRTPEGVYTIIKKYPSRRFRWFLRLNYPNVVDRDRYEAMRSDGVVPIDDDGETPKVGSAIGIHGTDVPILNSGHVNWTTGCISVDNDAIEELDRTVPVGTVVIINP